MENGEGSALFFSQEKKMRKKRKNMSLANGDIGVLEFAGTFLFAALVARQNTTSEKGLCRLERLHNPFSQPISVFLCTAFFLNSAYFLRYSAFAPMTALMRRTPAEEDSSFWILKETSSAVLEA